MLPNSFHTSRLALRPIAPEDAGPIFDGYATDREVTRFLTWRPHRSRADTDAYIAHCVATPPHVSRTYVLVDHESHTVRGALALRLPGAGRVEFGYVMARHLWGRGLMTELLTEVAGWALTQPSIFRVGAVCDAENLASARVMEKAGLTPEGLLRRWLISPNISDEPRDFLIYARTRPPA
jgi:ribosomal-protein-alanine N-acetyltransferase